MKILILGGTSEARDLAGRLVAAGHQVVTSLAGRTQRPMLPEGDVRVGKFGGIPGLVGYLRMTGVDRLVDATQPYAGLISINAVTAAQQAGVRLVRFMRPAWTEPAGANWVHVTSLAEAANALPSGAIVLVTSGKDGLELLLARDDCKLLVRLPEAPATDLPDHARLVMGRMPYKIEDEIALFRREAITHVVSRNSGGAQSAAKLDAARITGAKVIMLARPVYGPAIEVAEIDEAMRAVLGD